jgi:hypothetical protein
MMGIVAAHGAIDFTKQFQLIKLMQLPLLVY